MQLRELITFPHRFSTPRVILSISSGSFRDYRYLASCTEVIVLEHGQTLRHRNCYVKEVATRPFRMLIAEYVASIGIGCTSLVVLMFGINLLVGHSREGQNSADTPPM